MTLKSALLAACGVSAGAPPAATDPYFRNVSLLLNDTGTNGQQNNTFLDSSTNNFTITRNGTPTQGSVTPYWPDGQWSNSFSGTQYFVLGGQSAFSFNADFTVEMFFYLNGAGTGTPKLYESRGSGQEGAYVTIEHSGTSLVFRMDSAARITTTVTYNTWNHVAVVRSGTTITMYLNGVSAGTYTKSGTLLVGTSRPCIGAYPGFDNLNGYVSNLRVVKGTAIYTSNFTPSTTPLTAVSGTSLLTCQSNRFKDNSSNNFAITVTGTPSVQSFDPFSPAASYDTSVGGSGYFPGATASFLSLAQDTAFDFGTGEFTVEALVYPLATTQQAIVGKWTGTGQVAWILQINPGSSNVQFAYGNNGSFSANVTFSGATGSNRWSHIAVTRSGTSVRAFVNGVQVGTTQTISANMTATNANLVVGKVQSDNNNAFNGYISNLRVVKGTAVYISNFTTPTAPVTAITGTSLLLNYTNAGIYDAAVLNDLVTVGNAQVSTTQAKFGSSSMKFDGTGDWLTFVDSPVTRLETGNFTVEGWVYLSTTGTAKYIAAKGTSTTGWALGVNASNQIVFNYTSSTLTGSTALSSGQWYHVAVVRNGTATGNVKIYLDGTAEATSGGAINDNFNQTSIGYVGADRTGANAMNGYLDDLRITKGYARYTANFSVPTAPFPTR